MRFPDTGTGMPPDVVEKAFNPFFTTKETGKGTGLGLSMVYGFATQSQGAVWIDSHLGEGTTISMCLPRASSSTKEAPQSDVHGRAGRQMSQRILLVEDDPHLGAAITSQLKSLGHEVQLAETAQMALETLAEVAGFDMILTDIVMPGGINGIELCEHVQALFPTIPTILMTGYAQDAFERCGRKPEEFIVLYKPFGQKDLTQLVERVIEMKTVAQG